MNCFAFCFSLSGCPLAPKLALQNAEAGRIYLKLIKTLYSMTKFWCEDKEGQEHFNAVVEIVIPWIELTIPTWMGAQRNFPRQYVHRCNLRLMCWKKFPLPPFQCSCRNCRPMNWVDNPNIEWGVGEFSKTIRPPLQLWTHVLEKNPLFLPFQWCCRNCRCVDWVDNPYISKTIRPLSLVPDGNQTQWPTTAGCKLGHLPDPQVTHVLYTANRDR